MYPYILTSAGLSDEVLFPTPGLEQFATTGSTSADANRGAYKMNDIPYFVNGGTLYSVDEFGTETSIGSIDGDERVSFATNGTQLVMVVSGLVGTPASKGYIYTTAGGLVAISDADFLANGNPDHVVYIDGYFVCSTDEKKFIGSALNDAASWNALDFSSADVDPDPITIPVVLNNSLYMFGSETIEGFRNQPVGADFPFIRNGITTDTGTKSPWSVVKFRSAIYFVGAGKNESPAVWRYTGSGAPEKISTEPIDTILHELTEGEVEDVFAVAYTQKGHYFVEFTTQYRTLVYEITSGRWHERQSRVEFSDGSVLFTRHRINSVVTAYGKLLVGDYIDGRIGEMDIDIYDEYGEVIRRRIATQPFQNYNRGFSVPQLELTMESGVGNSSETDPQMELTRSTDGGKTWSYPRLRSVGKEGEYNVRQIWRRLGRAARNEVFAFTTTAKAKIVIIQLTAIIVLHRK